MTTTTPRRRIIGVSTKTYFTAKQTRSYIDSLIESLSKGPSTLWDQVEVFVVPDPITFAPSVEQIQKSRIPILPGSQDTFYEDSGPYTGEVSPAVLSELGCRIVEIGHAERRRLFGEEDDIVARKAAAVVRNGMIPLVCIGETVSGSPQDAVAQCQVQIDKVLGSIPGDAEVVLAYEPVWAIGAAKPADARYVLDVVAGLRALESVKSRKLPVRIIYGGSAGTGLFAEIRDGVDGLFVGRFGHDPSQFRKMIYEVAGIALDS